MSSFTSFLGRLTFSISAIESHDQKMSLFVDQIIGAVVDLQALVRRLVGSGLPLPLVALFSLGES
jgi:hypothetical protein